MAVTYKKIASVTVGSTSQTLIQFLNIPATYTDLVIKVSGRSSGSAGGATWDGIRIRPNGSTTSLSTRAIYGVGSGAGSTTDANVSGGETSSTNATASTFGNSEIYIPNYLSSSNKAISADGASENNGTSAALILAANLWSSTQAISSFNLALESGSDFVQYSTATLYGISNS